MRVLSLFSGGGLGDYGLELAGMEIVGQVEIDDYCQKVLALRWPNVPKWKDICHVQAGEIIESCGQPDVVSGGFPCQAYSTAARGRNNARCYWQEMLRLIEDIKPRFVVAENVIERPIRMAEKDLQQIGYFTKVQKLSAAAFGADHKRNRWWLLAHSNSYSKLHGSFNAKTPIVPKVQNRVRNAEDYARAVRDANGSSNRLDRLKLLGNGQVVQVVQWIGERIMESEAPTLNNPTEKQG